MANYMFVLHPIESKIKTVCLACAKRGEVVDSCQFCHGNGIITKAMTQYGVKERPIRIDKIDRDPETGILRYWENSCEFFYETAYPELNKYVPNVPHGIHFCHDDMKSAMTERDRINKYLKTEAKESFETVRFEPV